MADLQYIRAEIGHPLRKPRQTAGPVGDHDREAAKAAVLDQTGFDDARDQVHVDIAARYDQADIFFREREFFIDQSGEGHGRGAFGDGFFDLEQEQHRVGDLAFAHRNDFIDVTFYQFERRRADGAHRDTIGDRRRGRNLCRRAIRQSRFHRRHPFGLHADDTDLWHQCFERERDAGDQTAAAYRHHNRVQIGILFVKLETDGALTGDDPGIVEGRDESQLGLLA